MPRLPSAAPVPRREYENFPAGEVQEMVELYMGKGFSEEDARAVIDIYTRQPAYKDVFIDHMMVEELGYIVPKGGDASKLWFDGLVTALSFAGFGSLPLWLVAALEAFQGIDFTVQAGAGAAVTMVALFGLGVCKVRRRHRTERARRLGDRLPAARPVPHTSPRRPVPRSRRPA